MQIYQQNFEYIFVHFWNCLFPLPYFILGRYDPKIFRNRWFLNVDIKEVFLTESVSIFLSSFLKSCFPSSSGLLIIITNPKAE
jgi:hypothetical protein